MKRFLLALALVTSQTGSAFAMQLTAEEYNAIFLPPQRGLEGGMPQFSLGLPLPEDLKPPTCQLKKLETYHLSVDTQGHAVMPLLVDKKRLFIVDTGGAYSTLYSSAAKEMKLPIQIDKHGSQIGVIGQVTSEYVTIPSFTTGAVMWQNAIFAVDEDDRPLPLADNEVVGTFAPNNLMTFDVDFDFGKSRMNLFSPHHCPGAVVYWANEYTQVPFMLDNGHIHVDMKLDGHPVKVLIDTGAPKSVMNLDTAEALFGFDPNPDTSTKDSELAKKPESTDHIYRKQFHSLAVPGFEIKNPNFLLLPDKFRKATLGDLRMEDVIIGLPELARLHLYIAYHERMLYLTDSHATMNSPAPPSVDAGKPSGAQ